MMIGELSCQPFLNKVVSPSRNTGESQQSAIIMMMVVSCLKMGDCC